MTVPIPAGAFRYTLAVALFIGAVLGGLAADPARAHQSGCHSAHSCPSDHHTYIWYDGGGQGWDCVSPGAAEYNPATDTTVITNGGYTYYCRAAGTPPPPPSPACSDGLDNDFDFKVDFPADPGCTSSVDSDETDMPLPPANPTAPRKCGSERWSIKTLSDPEAGQVHFTPKRTTVATLRRLGEPPLTESSPRLRPVELTTYKVRAQLVQMKQEDDRDIHLVISTLGSRRRTMIVEFPDVACQGAATSAKKTQMGEARDYLYSSCGSAPRSRFARLRGRATITGVGFFDFKHGQKGIAPNGIELHPVLKFRSSNCKKQR